MMASPATLFSTRYLFYSPHSPQNRVTACRISLQAAAEADATNKAALEADLLDATESAEKVEFKLSQELQALRDEQERLEARNAMDRLRMLDEWKAKNASALQQLEEQNVAAKKAFEAKHATEIKASEQRVLDLR